MRKLILCACWLLLLLAAGCSNSGAVEPIWLGHLAPLHGPGQARGEAEITAMQVTLEEAREEGWSIGGRPVAVRHVDAANGAARAEAVRLLAVNRVAGLILGPGVPDVEEVAAVARGTAAGVVVLDEVATVPSGPVKLLGPDPGQRGRALARFAQKHLGKKRAALLLDSRSRLSAALALAFTAAWQPAGQVREWRLDSGDVKGPLGDVAGYKPEVILAALPAARLPEVAGLLPPGPVLYGGPDEEEAALLAQAQGLGAANEVYSAAVWSPSVRVAVESEGWRRRCEGSLHQPPGRDAVLARDGLRLLMAALEKEKTQKSLQSHLRQELSAIEEFASVTGKVTWAEGRPVRVLFLVRLAPGKPQVVQTVAGDEP
jgi:ABC-type branched-subunit amino acid transport system substrate-binding protein